MTFKKLIILFAVILIGATLGCFVSTILNNDFSNRANQMVAVDVDTGKGINFVGDVIIDNDDNIISYNIIGYVDFVDEDGTHSIGKITLIKDDEISKEHTSYDVYITNPNNASFQIHISGDAPLVKASVVGYTMFGEFERETYVEYPEFIVSYTATTGFQFTQQGKGVGLGWL